MINLSRSKMAGFFIILGFFSITILSFLLPVLNTKLAVIVLDYNSKLFQYPFTIQNMMLLIFFVGLGELLFRWNVSRKEIALLKEHLLPEDERTMLQSHDLVDIRSKVVEMIVDLGECCYLPNMINQCILQFQASKSVEQVNNFLNSFAEIYANRIDLKYTLLRYIAWVIPTIGFVGTVIGIASTLTGIESQNIDMAELTSTLGVAFNTTLVALVISAILVLLIHLVQEKEERGLNNSLEYCLLNLVNRLYVP